MRAQIAIFSCTFSLYSCTNCHQLHPKICPGCVCWLCVQWGAETMQLPPAAIQTGYAAASKDWSATDTGDWAAASTAPAVSTEWGGSSAENWG